MANLLTERLIRFRAVDGSGTIESLPGVYEAMVADRVESFPALRPHQRHAWHAFLAQLAVLALTRAGRHEPPRLADEWRQLLRDLTADFLDDEPWRLVVQDPSRPAFMQCPAPSGLSEYKKSLNTPDDLDLLVTSKNHDLKSSIAADAEVDDWVFSLVSLQTMSGYPGRGNYGIARMNGGYSSRPCLGLAPAEGGLGAHLVPRHPSDDRAAIQGARSVRRILFTRGWHRAGVARAVGWNGFPQAHRSRSLLHRDMPSRSADEARREDYRPYRYLEDAQNRSGRGQG